MLKTDGIYIAISYGKPESRAVHFDRPHLKFANKQFVLYPADCKDEEAKEEKSHFIYVCRKLPGADEACTDNWDKVVSQLKREAEEEAQALVDACEEEEEDSD